jgi:hypothetical protein
VDLPSASAPCPPLPADTSTTQRPSTHADARTSPLPC